MNTPSSLHQQFQEVSSRYYTELKQAFVEAIEKASDKQYAYLYYQRYLLERNQRFHYNSAFFQYLKATFVHYFSLNQVTALEETLKAVPGIRELSTRTMEAGLTGRLPDVYAGLMEEDGATLEEILAEEMATRSLTEENILQILALFHAAQQLLQNLEKLYPFEALEKKQHKYSFSRSQQVLFAYYLFQLAGIKPRGNASITTCAELLHAFTGTPYTSIKNSELYKKLRNPLGSDDKDSPQILADLRLVRTYFEKLDHPNILVEIDKDINYLTKK